MTKLKEELDNFLAELDSSELLHGISDSEKGEASRVLSIFKSESHTALSLIESQLESNQKILEVGAGLCILSLFLKKQGYNITACEPVSDGFDAFYQLKENILQKFSHLELEVIEKEVQVLNSTNEGFFDLIFSNNVVEHIQEFESAIRAMSEILNVSGKMIHGCPNYLVPYEPHFGIPIIKFLPKLSKTIWQKKILNDIEVWDSLNFITYFEVKKFARKLNLSTEFCSNTTYSSFNRIREDSEFQKRHKNTIVGKIFSFLVWSKTLKLLKLLPTFLNTPMVFTIKKNNAHHQS